MRKRYLILLLLCFLAGCSERVLEFDRTYPDTSKLDLHRAQIKAMQQVTSNSGKFDHLIEFNTKPENVTLASETLDAAYSAYPLSYCWMSTYEECSDLKPIDIFSNSNLFANITLNANSKVILTYYHESILKNVLPTPDDIEFYIFHKDLTLTPYPSTKVDQYTYEFLVPSDPTTHMLMFKAIYKTQIGGVTYYPIEITGK